MDIAREARIIYKECTDLAITFWNQTVLTEDGQEALNNYLGQSGSCGPSKWTNLSTRCAEIYKEKLDNVQNLDPDLSPQDVKTKRNSAKKRKTRIIRRL